MTNLIYHSPQFEYKGIPIPKFDMESGKLIRLCMPNFDSKGNSLVQGFRYGLLHHFDKTIPKIKWSKAYKVPRFQNYMKSMTVNNYIKEKLNVIDCQPEIMVPLVGTVREFEVQDSIIRETAETIFKERNDRIDFLVGTMIEVPRAALMADLIAEKADFFSFGTNDLTQMTFGYSRDDASKFLPVYIEKGILKADPFEVIDEEGVGQLVKIGTQRGRSTKPNLKVGLCGEHGGEPSSVEFCYNTGIDYVSCSPYRIPIARLVAAQAAIKTTI